MNDYRLRVGLLVLAALIGCYILLVPPVIGLANQGDFSRLMNPFGIAYPINVSAGQQYWCFTDVHFILTEPKPETVPFVSSQFLFVLPAYFLNRVTSKSNAFDIRALAIVELGALLFLFWNLAGLISDIGGRGRMIGLVVLTLVTTDLRNLAYFNTFYADQAAFLFGLAFLLCFFNFLRNMSAHTIGLLTVASVLLITSKAQHAPLGIIIAISLAIVPFIRSDWRPLLSLCLVAAATLFVTALCLDLQVSEKYRDISLYNTVFSGLLFDSDSPGRDLATLGIDPAAASYKGTHAFSPRTAGPNLFPGTATFPKVLLFYALHPKYLARRTARVITTTTLSNELPYLGYFERGYGYKCQGQTAAFSLWDSIRSSFAQPLMVIAFFTITIPVGLILVIRHKSQYAFGYVVLAVMAVASFYVAALGDMVDARHLLFFNLLFDCCLCCTLLYVWNLWKAWSDHRGTSHNSASQGKSQGPGMIRL